MNNVQCTRGHRSPVASCDACKDEFFPLLSDTETEAETIARILSEDKEIGRQFSAGEILGPISKFASEEFKKKWEAFHGKLWPWPREKDLPE